MSSDDRSSAPRRGRCATLLRRPASRCLQLATSLALSLAVLPAVAAESAGARLPRGNAASVQTPQAARAWLDYAREIGAWGEALRIVQQHPTLVDAVTRRQIEQAAAALAIRQGAALREADVPGERDRRLDAALVASASVDSPTSTAPSAASTAAAPPSVDPATIPYDLAMRIDRVVALRERGRFREAVELRDAIGELPDFALAAAADAALALREPERARQDYLSAIAGRRSPVAWDWRIGLAYAELEAERPDEAAETLALLDEDVRAAYRNAPDPLTRSTTRRWVGRVAVLRSNFERYLHRTEAASKRVSTLEDETPFDMDVRSARIAVTIDQGRPDSALKQATRLRIDHPDSIWPRVTEIEALTAASDFRGAREATAALAREENEPMQAERLSRRANRDAAGRVSFEIGLAAGDSAGALSLPAREHWYESRVESRRMDDAWRLTGFVRRADADIDGRSSHRTRLGAGVRHEAGRLVADGFLATRIRGGKVGGGVGLKLRVQDGLSVGLRHTRDDDGIPVRADRAGIRLNVTRADLEWRARTTTWLALTAALGQFTDSNRRNELAVGWTERWLDSPRLTLDTRVGVGRNRHATDDVSYFSPREDLVTSLSLVATHRIRRHYDTDWVHRFVGGPTWHRQAGYGSGGGLQLRYEHEYVIDGWWGGRASIEWIRRPYDGRNESRQVASIAFFTRF